MKKILFPCQVLKLTQIKYTMFSTDLLASVALWIMSLTSTNDTLMIYCTSIFIWIHSSRSCSSPKEIRISTDLWWQIMYLARAGLTWDALGMKTKCSLSNHLFSFIWERIPPDFCKQKQNFILGKGLYFTVANILLSSCNLVSMFIPCGVIQMDLFNFPCPTFCHRCFVLATC